ncbi:uncharacterized protein LOC141617027 [Silene latifolia]|uniref:uncharacterized protein LOC141617027 n=1 Tax=Silene latifolia TaxID=37657 RepID=UPI003D78436C
MAPQRRKRSRKNPSDGEASRKKRRYGHRGRTVLDMVAKAFKEKKPIELEWDKEDNLPTGKYASKFSSWIGVTVRGHVSCALDNWEKVDGPTLDLMLGELTGAFNVIEERHDWCLQKLGELWRKWKCTLHRKWMYDETGAVQMTPPSLYKQITQDHWNAFVASHSTEDFKAISKKNKENAGRRRGTYYGSRAGYRGVRVKVKKDLAAKGKQVEKVDRYLTWLRGHKSDKGDMTDYVKEVALKIEAIEKDVEAGVFVPKGREDILAKAIGKLEHPGRVRGVPQGISITEYFGKGPKKPTREELYEKINCMQVKIDDIEKMKAMMMHFWQSGEKPSLKY